MIRWGVMWGKCRTNGEMDIEMVEFIGRKCFSTIDIIGKDRVCV